MAFSFERNENVADAVRRIVAEEARAAASELGGGNPDVHDGVHQARKCCKRIRSVLRLVRRRLGKDLYRCENRWFRDVGRQLSAARDAEAMIEVYDYLRECYAQMATAPSLQSLRTDLVRRRNRVTRDQVNLEQRAAFLSRQMADAVVRVAAWPLGCEGFEELEPGFERSYRRGQRAMARARNNPTDENFHEWRKRVKDHWHHGLLLSDGWGENLLSRVPEIKQLSDLLGHDHDLTVLQHLLAADEEKFGGDAGLLGRYAERQQAVLRPEALRLGGRLYAPAPEDLVDEMREQWAAWWGG